MLTLTELERRAYAADRTDLADALARLEDVSDAAARLLAALEDCDPVSPDVTEAAQALEKALP